jgi:hypothetical protein
MVKISLALFMTLSMLASGLGIDIYYHYCGETGNRHTSIYYKADCSPETDKHTETSCGSEIDCPEAEASCCHHDISAPKKQFDDEYDNHCSNEHKNYSEELISIISNNDDLNFFVPWDIIRINYIYIEELNQSGLKNYLKQTPPLIKSPYKKLYIFTGMKISSTEPAELA